MNDRRSDSPEMLDRMRLPRWLLPADWPAADDGAPALASVRVTAGTITDLRPSGSTPADHAWDLAGSLALPGLVDAHTHLDKAFTRARTGRIEPGLLGAIDAMLVDRAHWTAEDVRERAERGLRWAWANGTTHLRSHVDWWEPEAVPVAWNVLAELADVWRGRMRLEQVSLIKLDLFEDAGQARRLAQRVAATGPHALLGAFVHSTNWSEAALRHLFEAALACGLDVDLHVDEELNASAVGLATTARLLREMRFDGRVVCGHCCALAAQDETEALRTLDAVAQAPITMVSLPCTNLLLQDAVSGRTPRLRGVTLIKEARERGIPLLLASDNVQDPFCASGSFDPAEALGLGALAAQLEEPFDRWSDTICRADWLDRTNSGSPTLVGARADLVLFPESDRHSWPSRTGTRVVMRGGRLVHGELPAGWTTPTTTTTRTDRALPA